MRQQGPERTTFSTDVCGTAAWLAGHQAERTQWDDLAVGMANLGEVGEPRRGPNQLTFQGALAV